MIGIARRRKDVEPFVEGFGFVVLSVHSKRTNAGDFGGPHRAQHGVLEKAGTQPFALPLVHQENDTAIKNADQLAVQILKEPAPVWDPSYGKHIPCITLTTEDLTKSRGWDVGCLKAREIRSSNGESYAG